MLAVQVNASASVDVGVLDDRTYLELALALILSFESIAEPKTPSPPFKINKINAVRALLYASLIIYVYEAKFRTRSFQI